MNPLRRVRGEMERSGGGVCGGAELHLHDLEGIGGMNDTSIRHSDGPSSRAPRGRRAIVAVAATIATLALSQTTLAGAHADDQPYDLEFMEENSLTIEYGEYWSFTSTSNEGFYVTLGAYEGACKTYAAGGSTTGYLPALAFYLASPRTFGNVWAADGSAALGTGTYDIGIRCTRENPYSPGDTYSAKTTVPALLTVEKAKLGIELRVTADSANDYAAIVTARFTGRFIDEYVPSTFPGAPLSPGGSWRITIRDADEKVVEEQTIERTAGDDSLATSFYWEGAEPGEQYWASGEFVADSDTAANFDIRAPTVFAYTGPEPEQPQPSSTATAAPDADVPEPIGPGVPLWSIILIGAAVAGLVVTTILLSVRLNRRLHPAPEAEMR